MWRTTRRLHLLVFRVLFCVVVGTVLLIADLAQGYDEKTTHRDLAEGSIELAVGVDSRYQELDWHKAIIVDADEAEDEGCRSENHFFDPVTSQGVPLNDYTILYMDTPFFGKRQSFCWGSWGRGNQLPRYLNALEWARDGMPSGAEKLDWHAAIEAYDYTPEAKAHAYKATGHVLHLLQDMGQPDHAKDRPHPCGYINPGSDSLFSYETLWAGQRKTWRKGTAPKKFGTLDEAFLELAKDSQRAEKGLGLPLPDELSLGCRALVSINDPNVESVKAWLLSCPGVPLPFCKAAEDSLWAKYEWPGLPAVRTIPGPPGDYRTRAYLGLGNTLLPAVEEYGAGLLTFFHDIVTPPAYVEEVEISQNGQQKYRKTWRDETSGDPPRVTGRRAEFEGGELEAGTEAKIVIRIGPKDPAPKARLTVDRQPIVWRRALKSLAVIVVPDGGGPDEATPVQVKPGSEPTSPQGVGIWEGTFTPTRSATLRITGTDSAEHFKDEGGQREQSLTPVDGKRGSQGDLDSNPSTPSRATWQESKSVGVPAGPPYPWTGYEAGPDTNHRFTIRGGGCSILAQMRWGKWAVTYTSTSTVHEARRVLKEVYRSACPAVLSENAEMFRPCSRTRTAHASSSGDALSAWP